MHKLVAILLLSYNVSFIYTFVSAVIRFGFQNASYTFLEPSYQAIDDGLVILHKENGSLTEQVFYVLIAVISATPNSQIRPASLLSEDENGDYTYFDYDYGLFAPNRTEICLQFLPNSQILEVYFELYGDGIAEGTESFQVTANVLTSSCSDDVNFVPPVASTFIIIQDVDRELYLQCMYTASQ